jgi:hypothetical protein
MQPAASDVEFSSYKGVLRLSIEQSSSFKSASNKGYQPSLPGRRSTAQSIVRRNVASEAAFVRSKHEEHDDKSVVTNSV